MDGVECSQLDCEEVTGTTTQSGSDTRADVISIPLSQMTVSDSTTEVSSNELMEKMSVLPHSDEQVQCSSNEQVLSLNGITENGSRASPSNGITENGSDALPSNEIVENGPNVLTQNEEVHENQSDVACENKNIINKNKHHVQFRTEEISKSTPLKDKQPAKCETLKRTIQVRSRDLSNKELVNKKTVVATKSEKIPEKTSRVVSRSTHVSKTTFHGPSRPGQIIRKETTTVTKMKTECRPASAQSITRTKDIKDRGSKPVTSQTDRSSKKTIPRISSSSSGSRNKSSSSSTSSTVCPKCHGEISPTASIEVEVFDSTGDKSPRGSSDSHRVIRLVSRKSSGGSSPRKKSSSDDMPPIWPVIVTFAVLPH